MEVPLAMDGEGGGEADGLILSQDLLSIGSESDSDEDKSQWPLSQNTPVVAA